MPSVSIFSEDRKSHCTIERTAHESYDLSQQFDVLVVQNGFSGKVRVWCDESVLRLFVEQLRECERLRRGEAKLQAMSPQDFSLRISNTRSKGDFAVSYEISDFTPSFRGHLSRCFLQGEFDLDPSLLLQLLRDFEGLATIAS